jgi:hypothetical protein
MAKKKKNKEIRELQLKVVRLYDEFAQFSDQCAFLCDSFAAIPAQHEFIEAGTIGGIEFYSRWLKTRLLEIKNELRKIHEQLREI